MSSNANDDKKAKIEERVQELMRLMRQAEVSLTISYVEQEYRYTLSVESTKSGCYCNVKNDNNPDDACKWWDQEWRYYNPATALGEAFLALLVRVGIGSGD